MTEPIGDPLSVKREFSDVLWEVYPHPKYPTISITGESCSLNCDFCEGKYLRSMMSVQDPEELYDVCLELNSDGCRGVLLSGGFNEMGYVPFEGFVEAISRVKAETDLYLSIHPGLLPTELSTALADSGVDAVFFDLIADDELIKERMDLDRTSEDYKSSLNSLIEDFSSVSPHVLLGLSRDLDPERRILDVYSGYDFSSIVFLVLVPLRQSVETPSPEDVGVYLEEARLAFPDIPVSLGCMRPKRKGRIETEKNAVLAGVDRIVQPTEEAKEEARREGLSVRRLDACCGIPESLALRWESAKKS